MDGTIIEAGIIGVSYSFVVLPGRSVSAGPEELKSVLCFKNRLTYGSCNNSKDHLIKVLNLKKKWREARVIEIKNAGNHLH